MSEEHSSPIKTWQQLVVVVVAAFIVPIIVIAMLASLVSGGAKRSAVADDNEILARIRPVGTVEFAKATGPRVALSGEQVYAQVCKACHEAGVAGAHKMGDKAAWAKVIAQGDKTTFDHALRGIRAMPPKGGNPDLADHEVQAAVVHMANAAGAAWKAPAAPAITTAATGAERTGAQVVAAACGKCHQTGEGGAPKIGDRTAWIQREKQGLNLLYQSALRGHAGMPARGGMAELNDAEVKRAVEFMMNSGAAGATVAAATAVAAPAAPAAPATVDGKKVYDTACTACHAAGIAGAPKSGDKAAWAPRIAQGANVLYDHAIKGFQGKAGVMPARGGNTSLSDADVKAAVDYMVAGAK